MYAKLKQVMAAEGYTMSEGEGWMASDTEQFVAFSKYVLGVQAISPNQIMAYPQAFPNFIEALQRLTGDVNSDPSAPEDAAVENTPPAVEVAPPEEDTAVEETAPATEESQDTSEAPAKDEAPAEDTADETPAKDEAPAADPVIDVSGQ